MMGADVLQETRRRHVGEDVQRVGRRDRHTAQTFILMNQTNTSFRDAMVATTGIA